MSRSLRDQARLVLILTAVSVLAAACVKPNDPGVSVKGIKAEIVFGVKEPEEPTAPANTGDLDEIETVPVSVDLPPALLPELPPERVRTTTTRRGRAVIECPTVSKDTFPDVAAPFNVPFGTKPEVGTYRWKKAGQIESFGPAVQPPTGPPGAAPAPPNRGPSVKTPITGFETRAVRNVTVIRDNPRAPHPDPTLAAEGQTVAESVYTFQTVQPELDGETFVITTFKVDTANLSRTVVSPVNDLESTNGEAERGIAITEIERVDIRGQVKGDPFDPADGAGLLILPLDVRQGEQFRSFASDAGRGRETIRIDGNVVGRRDVDMCGTLVQAWEIKSTLTITGSPSTIEENPTPQSREWTYYIAPHFGGVIVREVVKQVNDQGDAFPKTILDLDTTQGQVKPN